MLIHWSKSSCLNYRTAVYLIKLFLSCNPFGSPHLPIPLSAGCVSRMDASGSLFLISHFLGFTFWLFWPPIQLHSASADLDSLDIPDILDIPDSRSRGEGPIVLNYTQSAERLYACENFSFSLLMRL